MSTHSIILIRITGFIFKNSCFGHSGIVLYFHSPLALLYSSFHRRNYSGMHVLISLIRALPTASAPTVQNSAHLSQRVSLPWAYIFLCTQKATWRVTEDNLKQWMDINYTNLVLMHYSLVLAGFLKEVSFAEWWKSKLFRNCGWWAEANNEHTGDFHLPKLYALRV